MIKHTDTLEEELLNVSLFVLYVPCALIDESGCWYTFCRVTVADLNPRNSYLP